MSDSLLSARMQEVAESAQEAGMRISAETIFRWVPEVCLLESQTWDHAIKLLRKEAHRVRQDA